MEQRTGSAGLGLAVLSAAAFGTSGTFAASLLEAGWTAGSAVTARVVTAALVLAPFALLQLRGQLGLLRRGVGALLGAAGLGRRDGRAHARRRARKAATLTRFAQEVLQ